MRHHTIRLRAAAAAAAIIAALYGGCATSTTAQDDQDHGPHCGTERIDLTAPVVSVKRGVRRSSPQTISSILTDINAWPTWKADVPTAQRLGECPIRVHTE